MQPENARDLLEALGHQDGSKEARRRLDAAFRAVDADMRKTIEGVCFRYGNRMRSARITSDDVHQAVVTKLLRSPPAYNANRNPVATLRSWLNTTTSRLILDLSRRPPHESIDGGGGSEDAKPPTQVVSKAPIAERLLEQQAEREILEDCMSRLPTRGMRCLEILFDDPDISGRELAGRLEIWKSDPPDGPTDRQINLAQKVRSDMKKALVHCLTSKQAFQGAFR